MGHHFLVCSRQGGPLIWWAIMALATAPSFAADDDGSGGVPSTGLLCISECGTCPVICSSPPPPSPKPVYSSPPSSPPSPKPVYYYYPPTRKTPPPPPPPSPISYSWGTPPPPNVYANIPALPSPPGMIGAPPGRYPYPYYYFYASTSSPPYLLNFSTTCYLVLLFFHVVFLRWL